MAQKYMNSCIVSNAFLVAYVLLLEEGFSVAAMHNKCCIRNCSQITEIRSISGPEKWQHKTRQMNVLFYREGQSSSMGVASILQVLLPSCKNKNCFHEMCLFLYIMEAAAKIALRSNMFF